MTRARLNGRWSRPAIELLEDRRLLSTCHIARLGDFGVGADLGGGHSRGDLRFCINKANNEPGPDVIDITATGTITLGSALPNLSSDIDMRGPGADLLNAQKSINSLHRIFTVSPGAAVTISGLTISRGFAFDVGGGISNAGNLSILACTISDNTLYGTGPDVLGAGIYNTGSLFVRDSTVSGNSAVNVFINGFGGGIYNSGPLVVVNSSVSDNHLDTLGGDNRQGGGIYNAGSLSIRGSTIAANSAFDGGGIHNVESLTMNNVILADNTATFAPDLDGELASSGYNLVSNTQGGSGYAPTDLLNVEANLGPLQDNGGPTLTHALLPGSPAIDAGDPNPDNPPEWDQRGPGFPRIVNDTIDIGAFEVQAMAAPSFASLAVLVTADLEADEGMNG